MVELAWHLAACPPNPKYAFNRVQCLIDWQTPDIANFIFRESNVHAAVMCPLALNRPGTAESNFV